MLGHLVSNSSGHYEHEPAHEPSNWLKRLIAFLFGAPKPRS